MAHTNVHARVRTHTLALTPKCACVFNMRADQALSDWHMTGSGQLPSSRTIFTQSLLPNHNPQ